MRPFSWNTAEQIASELDLPLVVGVVLARRGFTSAGEARRFLTPEGTVPSPFSLPGMAAAVDQVAQSLEAGSRVVIHGDYDADGVTATALMVLGLRLLGADPDWFLPDRFAHGFGLSRRAVEDIAAEGPGLLVTVDCGVNYPEEVALARSLGLDVVVTDHHSPGNLIPPGPVVHPQLGGYSGSELSGVGVALKLLHGLFVRLAGAPEERLPSELEDLLDLVALGTVADVVPLVGENRYYVREGLRRIRVGQRVGVKALLDIARCPQDSIDAGAIAYRLAPRLNAPGRMTSPDLPLKLLLTGDPGEAGRIAQELEETNQRRQEVETGILEQALAEVERLGPLPPALVLAGEGWHEGVVGIVASRLVERFHRPVVLLALANDKAKGSGRSIPAYNLLAGLSETAPLLEVFGGHAQAAGVTLKREDIPAFRERLVAHAGSVLSAEDLVPEFYADAIVSGPELSLETAEALEQLEPFGAGNPPVRLIALDAELCEAGLTQNGGHLRCTLTVDNIRTRAIGFRLTDEQLALAQGGENPRVHTGLRLEINRWNGTMRPEVVLQSLFATESEGETLTLGCTSSCPHCDDTQSQAAFAGCLDMFAGSVPESNESLPGRDLRGRGAQFATLAQLASSGELVAVVCASVPHRLQPVANNVPLGRLGVSKVDCVSRLCWRTHTPEGGRGSLLFLDFPAAVRRFSLLRRYSHLVVLDPPYHQTHLAAMRAFSEQGGRLHLCYGQEERDFTLNLLKLLVHPRPLMVLLYRALRRGEPVAEAFRSVAMQAEAKYGIIPSGEELQRARRILEALDVLGGACADGNMRDASSVPEYAAAFAEYHEAVDLCRKL